MFFLLLTFIVPVAGNLNLGFFDGKKVEFLFIDISLFDIIGYMSHAIHVCYIYLHLP